jgi:trans-aconitate 2-methyltransferase
MGVEKYAWDAGDYERHSVAQQGWARELIAKLALRGDERVLDVGCGDGKVTAEIASAVPSGCVVGIDNSASMVGLARTRLHAGWISNLAFCLADALDLPFCSAFDVAFSNATLHWVRDHPRVLRSIRRSLRAGGRVLLQMGGRGNAAALLDTLQEVVALPAWRECFTGFSFPYAFYGPEQYAPWLREARLRPLRVELIPKDMTHAGAAGLEGWIRTTWLPYTHRVPEASRDAFVRELASRYLARHPLDEAGLAHVAMVRLEVEAVRRDGRL